MVFSLFEHNKLKVICGVLLVVTEKKGKNRYRILLEVKKNHSSFLNYYREREATY